MTREEFEGQMIKIQTAYNKKFASNELKLWFNNFVNTDIKEFEKAVSKTIKEMQFTPKIADIRARIAINPNDYYIDEYSNLYKNLEWCKIVKGE